MKYSSNERAGQMVYNNLADQQTKPKDSWTLYLLFCCFVAALSSFQFGYNIGVTNLPTPLIKNFFASSFYPAQLGLSNNISNTDNETLQISALQPTVNASSGNESQSNNVKKSSWVEGKTDYLWTITTSLFVVGGMFGAFTAKFVLDIFGRKYGIVFHNIFTVIASILVILSFYINSGVCVMLSRVFFGIQGGMSCSLIPTYLSEISPAGLRGATGVIHQLFITLGIVISQILGFRQILGTSNCWHFLLGMPIVPSALCVVLLTLFCPESPRALLTKNNGEDKARAALSRLRDGANVNYEINQIAQETEDSGDKGGISLVQLFSLKELRMPLITGIVLQLAQQLCGINAVFFYSERIFKEAKIDSEMIQYAVVCTGLVNIIMTIVVVPLIDRLGRKPLLVYPMILIVIDFIALTALLHFKHANPLIPKLSIVCIIVFIMCFAVGLGPVPFIYVAECFKQEARGAALSICMFTNWTANLLLTLAFPYMQLLLTDNVFLVFTVIVIGALVVICLKVPETKGRNPDEIMVYFLGKSYDYNRNENILMNKVRA